MFSPFFLYAFFCYFFFLCPNSSCYFPLLSSCVHLSSFIEHYEMFSILSCCMCFSSFNRLYKASPLCFHSTRPRLDHHHCHRSSSFVSFKFFLSCYQPFSLSFSFSILLPHLFFLVSIFSICSSLFSFLCFKK